MPEDSGNVSCDKEIGASSGQRLHAEKCTPGLMCDPGISVHQAKSPQLSGVPTRPAIMGLAAPGDIPKRAS